MGRRAAVGETESLVAVSRRRPEHRAVLQCTQKALEPQIGLQSEVLRVFVANRAEIPPHFTNGNDGTAELAG